MIPEIRGYQAAAKYCRLSVRTLKRLVRRKRVRAYKVSTRIIMFRASDLDAMIESKATVAL